MDDLIFPYDDEEDERKDKKEPQKDKQKDKKESQKDKDGKDKQKEKKESQKDKDGQDPLESTTPKRRKKKTQEDKEDLQGDNKPYLEGDNTPHQEDNEDLQGDNKPYLEGNNKPHQEDKEDLEGNNKPHQEDKDEDEDKDGEDPLDPMKPTKPEGPQNAQNPQNDEEAEEPLEDNEDNKEEPRQDKHKEPFWKPWFRERELVAAQSRDTDPDSEASLKSNYADLWVHCKHCSGFNYKKIFKSKRNVCEKCGSHLKLHSSDRIDLLLDAKTWAAMHEGLLSLDPIEFHSEKDPYKGRVASYKRETGLSEAAQTGLGYLKTIALSIGLMDFQFMGGSMGSVVGERIARSVEYANNQFLPLLLVCASGGARMQEGSVSLMQMAKISSSLSNYQFTRTGFFLALLTSPTTGGVTASFGMLGDIIFAEPNAYIAFAGKRVIEQTLNIQLPEGSQTAEYLFDKGLFDKIVPRNPFKRSLRELFNFHDFFTLNSKVITIYNYL
uniref:Acetyl-coenzyme A carboxylase carboxyl transferase subunit beta, chloroplastic n=1 Tax=Oenothera villaricae TaxID=3941 RepID=A8WF01_OENVI|nr:acetyl-CoA carboxylase subunit beta [Oenothera villaricae]ABW99115.2 acetyl-CoA carboxylase beta subunit [Oenothera villaricae]ANI87013.1 acetyl-CoA carboxylase subunit beta [Oenothera villaricae]